MIIDFLIAIENLFVLVQSPEADPKIRYVCKWFIKASSQKKLEKKIGARKKKEGKSQTIVKFQAKSHLRSDPLVNSGV